MLRQSMRFDGSKTKELSDLWWAGVTPMAQKWPAPVTVRAMDLKVDYLARLKMASS